MVSSEQQEPFRSRVDRWGLVVYTLAIVVGGPVIVLAKRAGADGALRVVLALAAAVGAALMARRAQGYARGLLAVAALAALARTALALAAVPRLPAALLEGAEMALVALGLAALARRDDRRTRGALVALALGAFGLKLAWGLEQVAVVRYGGLALLPLVVLGLRGVWPRG